MEIVDYDNRNDRRHSAPIGDARLANTGNSWLANTENSWLANIGNSWLANSGNRISRLISATTGHTRPTNNRNRQLANNEITRFVPNLYSPSNKEGSGSWKNN